LPDLFVPFEAMWRLWRKAMHRRPFPAELPKTAREITVIRSDADNYIGRIKKMLGDAKRSIHMQYAYITYTDKPVDQDSGLVEMLAGLSSKPNLDMKIIV